MSFQDVAVDRVKDYWDARPCNIRHSTKHVGSREYFDEVEARKYKVEPHIPGFADFDRWKGKRVLEIGCGIGTATIGFARAGARVTAIDLSDASLELARQRAKVYGLEDAITFYACNAEHLSDVVPIEPYDLIYSFGVIHHSPHPAAIVRQTLKYCRPGTEFRVMVYNRLSWKVLWMLMTFGKFRFWRLDDIIAENSEAQNGCPITYSYSKASLKDMLSRNGYSVKTIFADHIFPYQIPEYVNYQYVKEWYFRWMPVTIFRALEGAAGWHLCATAEFAGLDSNG